VENKEGCVKIGAIHPPAKARGILAKIDKKKIMMNKCGQEELEFFGI
jgi:hypothetical protein